MGGSDHESNLTEKISISEHAELHRLLWEQHGHIQDKIAWLALSGRINSEEARIAASIAGMQRSQKYKESRKVTGVYLLASRTKENCSKGGKVASKRLVEWQKHNNEIFKNQCAENGRNSATKKHIPHEYQGIIYESKKALQIAHNMSICGFYGKLRRGEIKRLPKTQ
jgi:hypothetical protein